MLEKFNLNLVGVDKKEKRGSKNKLQAPNYRLPTLQCKLIDKPDLRNICSKYQRKKNLREVLSEYF